MYMCNYYDIVCIYKCVYVHMCGVYTDTERLAILNHIQDWVCICGQLTAICVGIGT